jgi:exoribonuclease II
MNNNAVRVHVPINNPTLTAFIDGMRYAGLLTVDARYSEQVHIRCPKGQIFNEWAAQIIPHFKSLGFDSYAVNI